MLLSGLLLTSATGWAAEVRGRSSTQLLWYNDFFNGRVTELAEYLRLSITDIDKAGKFSIHGYGRASLDLNGGEGGEGRLYYLYGEYKNLYDKLDMRLGRQFVNLSAGSAIIDGAQVDVKNIGPVSLTMLGGRDVVFGVTGELSREGDYAFGISAALEGFKKTDADISWLRKWDAGDVSRDILGASFKQYLLNQAKVYGNVRYDLTGEVFNDVLAGVKYFPTANLILTGEWYQSYPTFDTTSIYSVFAVNRYQEGLVRADYTLNQYIAVNGGYSRQDYGDDGMADVYEFGTTIRPLHSLDIGLAYDKRHGYGGSMDGGKLDVTYEATHDLTVAAGMIYDVYQRDNMTGSEFGQKYWASGKYKIAKNMSASLRMEDEINKVYRTTNLSGRCVFNYDF
jgi:hypothetical protein